MTKVFDPAATAISAIENVSRVAATRADIKTMLASGIGEPSHVMALFSDVDFATLMRLAIAFEISDADFVKAYVHARKAYGASNPEFDDLATEMGMMIR